MNFLHQLTGRSANSIKSPAHSSRSAHSHGAAYSHRSTRESVGRRVHVDTDHYTGVSSSKVGIGAAIIMPQDGVDPTSYTTNSDGKLIPHDHYFVAVLAPDSEAAMAFLVSQPAGTYLLVRESGDEIAVYIKFVQAVRSFTVVEGKEIKKKTSESLVDWGKPYHTLSHTPRHVEALISQTTVMAPVHRITLPLDAYQFLEKCWLKFLPQVQAIVFELCSQSFYMDEDIAMDDWSTLILSSRVPTIAFLSVDSCGFHLINTSAIADAAFNDGIIAAASASASASAVVAALSVPVRLVEFDVSKCLISITDGVFRPSSFVTPVNFGNAKLYDAELGFTTIRDNFVTPERVTLKEASNSTVQASTNGTAAVASPALWQDLGMSAAISGDLEMQLLLAMHKCTVSMIPHEPLPEGFIDSFVRLHTLWAGQTPTQCRGRWRTPDKIKCSARILPYYVELFLATATTDPHVTRELRSTGKPDLLPCFAAALRHDILHMARRVDDETVARLVLHILQALQLRADVPSQLVCLVSDLVVESPQFRVLFMRNQGAGLLWKAIHMAVSMNTMVSPQLLMQTLSLQRNAPMLGATTKRRSSLFGGRRKSNSRGGSSRRSMAFNASLVMPMTMECSVQVYFRVNPVLVQLEVAPQLREAHLTTHDLAFRAKGSDFESSAQSALIEMIHFIERVAFFLMADPSSPTWEKDVMQLLRMEDLYEHLYREAVACVIESAAQTQRRMSFLVHSDSVEHSVEPILECIAALYRLETKRRRHTTTGIGEKRYWFLFHLLRNPVRAYHEAMREIMNALDNGEISSANAQPDSSQTNANYAAYDLEDRGPTATTGFVVLAQVLPKLPRQLVTEFVLVSLDDLLQATRILYEFIQRGLVGAIPYVRLLVSIFTVMLKRTCDYDLQLLLVRVLASSGSSMPAMLQLLAQESVKSTPEAGGCAIELELIAFVEAFVKLATSLVQKEKWHEIHETLYTTLENKEDVEGNEQRKTMLMATVLSPENGVADSDEILWDTIQSILLPVPGQQDKDGVTSPRLQVVDAFLSKDFFTVWDNDTGLVPCIAYTKLRVLKAYLRVRARLFLSSMLENAKATLPHLRTQVEFHWDHIYGLREQYKTTLFPSATTPAARNATAPTSASDGDGTVKIDGSECQALVLLQLRCVIALASRRSELPALDEAFRDFRTARELLRILRLESSKAIAASASAAASASSSAGSVLAALPKSLDTEPKVDGLRSPMGLSLNLDKLSHRTTSWSESSFATLAPSTWKTDELLLSSPELHATTLVAILACIVSEPHALSESLVPRFFIPQFFEGSSVNLLPDEDLLLTLQRHLSFVNSPELRGAIEAALQTSEFEQLIGSPARVHAVRTLTRILLPDSYDSHLFQTATGSSSNCISVREHHHQNTTLTTHGGDESDHEDHLQAHKVDPADPLASSPQPRTYVAKGAFASVYRATPIVYDAFHKQVAIKVWAHQRSSGDLCVAAELFNEITVLEHLQGNMAATQLLDYGNDTRDNQGFEVVMEHCPATLAQWRKSLETQTPLAHDQSLVQDGEPNEVPFRTLLSLVLSVFVDVASALGRIHSSKVCHFDVKADNVLVRVDAATLTAETLKIQRQQINKPDAGLAVNAEGLPRVCLADFGESIVLPPLSTPEGVVLSRTRGTEAIKSPEMLSVRGGESSSDPNTASLLVGPASDVWSLGCLLYELVTQELMFANDDWAQLYAHVVAAPSTTATVRDDHRQKLLCALRPKTDAEKGLAGVFIDFLDSILQWDVVTRPTIAKVVDEAQIQLRMIQSLPSQPEDDEYERVVLSRQAEPSSVPTLLLPVAQSLSAPRPKIVETAESPALGRLFFNFYLAKDVWALHRATPSQTPSAATARTASASAIAMASTTPQGEARLRRELSALQLRYESSFTHFIYFCYDDVKRRLLATNNADSTSLAVDASVTRNGSGVSEGSASEFVEIVEGVGRTVLYFSRARVLACVKEASDAANDHRASAVSSFSSSVASARGTTTAALGTTATVSLDPAAPSLMRLLLQYSRGILPVLQRHLRHQSNRVLIVPADYNFTSDHDASRPLTELTASTLLFFLVTSCGLSPLQAQTRFSRECGAIIDLPNPRLLYELHRLYDQLQSVASSVSESESAVQSRCVVRCRCGDKVLAVPSASLTVSTETLPSTADNAALVDCEAEPVWDCGDTNVVYKSSQPFSQWRVVDTLAVDRLDSQLRCVLRSQLGSTATGAAGPSSQRRRSHNSHSHTTQATPGLPRHQHNHHHDAALALRDHVPFLLRGLHETQTIEGTHPSQRTETPSKPLRLQSWSVYECPLCGVSLCALATATDKVALPVGWLSLRGKSHPVETLHVNY